MKTTGKAALVMGVTAVVVLAVAGLQFRREAKIAVIVRLTASANARQAAQVAEAKHRLENAEASRERTETALHELREKQSVRSNASESTSNPPAGSLAEKYQQAVENLRKVAANQLLELNNTETQVRVVADGRARNRVSYAPLFRQLGLSTGEQEKLLDLADARYERSLDVNAVVQEKQLDPVDLSVVRFREQIEEDFRRGLGELLGPEKLQRWTQFDQEIPVRNLVAGFVGGATSGGMDFSREQVEQLVTSMIRAAPERPVGKPVNVLEINWETVDAEAASYLTPEQQWFLKNTDSAQGTAGRFETRVNTVFNEAQQRDRTTGARAGR